MKNIAGLTMLPLVVIILEYLFLMRIIERPSALAAIATILVVATYRADTLWVSGVLLCTIAVVMGFLLKIAMKKLRNRE